MCTALCPIAGWLKSLFPYRSHSFEKCYFYSTPTVVVVDDPQCSLSSAYMCDRCTVVYFDDYKASLRALNNVINVIKCRMLNWKLQQSSFVWDERGKIRAILLQHYYTTLHFTELFFFSIFCFSLCCFSSAVQRRKEKNKLKYTHQTFSAHSRFRFV